MLKRWMTGWLAIWVIATISPIWAQSQGSSGNSDPDTLVAIPLPAPTPMPVIFANRYFPAFPGLTWTSGGNPRELALQVRMLETQDTTLGPVYLWDGFQGQRWVQNGAKGKVMEYRDEKWRMLFDLNAEAGTTWTVEPIGDGDFLNNAEMTVVSREEKIEVHYGEFFPVIHISVRNPNLADAGVTDLYFASEIGLVKWSETSIAGPQSYELASFINRNEPPIVIDPPRPPTPIIDLADLFPTRSGLIWEYSGSPLKTARRISLVGVERSFPPLTYLWEGFMGAQRIRKTDDGKIMEIIGESECLLFDLAAEEGLSWTINALEESGNLLDGSTITVISRKEDLTVPYGEFEQTLHLGLKPNPQLADAGVVDMWFAPGFGLVKWTEITIAGPQTYELFELSGSSVSPTPEPGDSLIVIEPTPIPLPEPIRPIEDYENRTQFERDGIRYEIGTLQASYNQSDGIEMFYRVTAINNEVTFQFNSTQHYDFRFLNENGEVVWVWSANIGFGDALTSFTLKPGESNTFFARMSLSFDIIPSGTYKLLGFMPTSAWQGETMPTESTQISLPFQIVGEPTQAGLFGTVTDEQGNPVGAVVSLTQPPPPVLSTEEEFVTSAVAAWTAHGGEFNFRGMEPGTYTLTARAEGYQIHAQQLDIAAGLNRIDIILKGREQSIYTNVHDMVKGAFIAELGTDKQQYAFGDSVYVRYRLTNISTNDLELIFPSGQRYDLHLDGSQDRVWTWSQDKSFILSLSSQTLAAGETYEFETAFILQDSWDKNTPSFLLSCHLAISQNGQVTSDMTEAIVKFAINGWEAPVPGQPDPLSASARITQEQYASGDTVNVNYHLTNTSDDSITLAFNSGQRYDLILNGPQGAVWGWSWTRLFSAETGELVIAPGDAFAFEEKIALSEIPNIADGVYVLRIYMTSTDELADATEAKSRFWLGDPPPPGTIDPLPADPTASEGAANIERTGDFDANGQVDFADFLNFASAFGTNVGMADYKTDFDFDSDGQVAFPDFLTFASVFGK